MMMVVMMMMMFLFFLHGKMLNEQTQNPVKQTGA